MSKVHEDKTRLDFSWVEWERMKPILFNTEMVKAILEDRKGATRRPVRPKYCDSVFEVLHGQLYETSPYEPPRDNGDGTKTFSVRPYVPCKPPYHPGDILYVRETWCDPSGTEYPILYRADMPMHWDAEDTETGEPVDMKAEDYTWRPSIHMPKDYARLFLRVTDVRVERLQDITDEQARKEGCADRKDFARVWNDCYAKPRAVKGEDGTIDHYESYPWEDIQETRIYRGKPWYVIGNPWLWVIEFERVIQKGA